MNKGIVDGGANQAKINKIHDLIHTLIKLNKEKK